ncbi:MAG: sulfatase [Chthoniobacterales bacterium]
MNLVFVYADQLRAGACGFDGNPMQITPNLDRMASRGVRFTNCISGMPVCGPWRACFFTGQYPLTHGHFLNDLRLQTDRPTLGTVLKQAGYQTAYIGKWHLDGPDRGGFIPPGPRRQGFDYWAAANCSHEYSHSHYYKDSPEPLYWEGYDAIAQTTEAIDYIDRASQKDKPFALVMSWGPPHEPYKDVPQKYLDRISPESVFIPPNCPDPNIEEHRGYYAHILALDEQIGRLEEALESRGLIEDTVFIFTSDHGDMLGSQGQQKKQQPWNESVRVPFLIRSPGQFASGGQTKTFLNVWDMMPTLLGLLGVDCPETVQGRDLSAAVRDANFVGPDATLACSIAPFGPFPPAWRAIISHDGTYVRNLEGPWLLYDNETDPWQLDNLVNQPEHAILQARLEEQLQKQLQQAGDDFQPSETYLKRWGYEVDDDKATPYFSSLNG